MKYRVVKSRQAEIHSVITIHRGDFVKCVELSDPNGDWAGWILCETESNKGWVPKQIIDKEDESGIVLEDYTSRELCIEVGEIIVMERILNGWIWGYKSDEPDLKAWVPLNHLKKLET